jgi:hypothetical protein
MNNALRNDSEEGDQVSESTGPGALQGGVSPPQDGGEWHILGHTEDVRIVVELWRRSPRW